MHTASVPDLILDTLGTQTAPLKLLRAQFPDIPPIRLDTALAALKAAGRILILNGCATTPQALRSHHERQEAVRQQVTRARPRSAEEHEEAARKERVRRLRWRVTEARTALARVQRTLEDSPPGSVAAVAAARAVVRLEGRLKRCEQRLQAAQGRLDAMAGEPQA